MGERREKNLFRNDSESPCWSVFEKQITSTSPVKISTLYKSVIMWYYDVCRTQWLLCCKIGSIPIGNGVPC